MRYRYSTKGEGVLMESYVECNYCSKNLAERKMRIDPMCPICNALAHHLAKLVCANSLPFNWISCMLRKLNDICSLETA